MLVEKDLTCEIPGTNTYYFRLDQMQQDPSDHVLLYGFNHLDNPQFLEKYKNFKRKTYLNVTMPTEFCSQLKNDADKHYDDVWTICPYSVNWLNEISQTSKYNTICYPFSELDIPAPQEKKYDVMYQGGIHGQYHIDCLNTITKFNYRYMSMTHGINQLTAQVINLGVATDLNLTNSEKIKRIAETKISVCYNYFLARDENDINNIKNRKDWWKNEAFSDIDDQRKIPQFKSRFNEAAMSKTLNLVQRDKWNIVENWFKPDEDFVYFDDHKDLENKIIDVLNNYEKYDTLIQSAYDKCLEHTSENLYNKIRESKLL